MSSMSLTEVPARFFSSRRRQTRYWRDWSSDVCSSDLGAKGGYDFDVPLLPGDFVTTEAGTGFVHIAPSHGEDDFNLGRENGLPVPETVNDDGTFTLQAPGFTGLHVFKAHDAVYAACEAAGTLVAKGKLTHSYPHSWRSKKPVIFRATPQWFIAMDDIGRASCRERV